MSRIDLPELGLGTAPLGNLYRSITDDQARGVVDASWDAGIRYYDTAPHYGLGLAERRLGEALRARPRDEYVLSTKIGRVLEPVDAKGRRDDDIFDVPGDHVRRWDFSADGVRRSLDDSLARLGLDRVDVLLIHDPDEHLDQAVREAVPALARLRDEGVVRAIGVGSGTPRSLAALIGTGALDVAMVAGRYTLLDQSALHEVLPAAEEHRTRVVAVSVFNSGVTATDPPTVRPTSTDRRRRRCSPARGASPRSARGTTSSCRRPPSASRCATRPSRRSRSAWPRSTRCARASPGRRGWCPRTCGRSSPRRA
jgi:D-threo-aldose 1-dehydrogenase